MSARKKPIEPETVPLEELVAESTTADPTATLPLPVGADTAGGSRQARSAVGDDDETEVLAASEASASATQVPAQVTVPVPAVDAPAAAGVGPVDVRPRIRFGSIAWGLIVIALAGLVLGVARSDATRDAAVAWATALGWGGLVVVLALVVGAFILLQGLLALLRRAQRP